MALVLVCDLTIVSIGNKIFNYHHEALLELLTVPEILTTTNVKQAALILPAAKMQMYRQSKAVLIDQA